jgi:UDP-2,4-diacetamido-2,4,6-trideoxy-beta-L-altropyranose hydrolase
LKKVLYITEYNNKSGAGHFYRYISIKQLFKKDWNITLCLNKKNSIQKTKIFWGNNFKIKKWKFILQKYSVIFVDSFILKKKIYKYLDQSKKCTIFLDDYLKRKYKNSLNIDWTIGIKKTKQKNRLFGERYCVVRNEFINKKYIVKKNNKLQVCCMFGGNDIKNITSFFYKNKKIFEENKITLKFIINKNYPSFQNLKNKKNIFTNLSTKKIIQKFLKSDLILTTAGQTLYEIASLKIPMISIIITKNQILDSIGFEQKNLSRTIYFKKNKDTLKKILLELNKLKKISIRKKINKRLNTYLFDGKLLKKKINKYVTKSCSK